MTDHRAASTAPAAPESVGQSRAQEIAKRGPRPRGASKRSEAREEIGPARLDRAGERRRSESEATGDGRPGPAELRCERVTLEASTVAARSPSTAVAVTEVVSP